MVLSGEDRSWPRCFFRQRSAQDIGEAQRTLFEEERTVAEPMAAQRLRECVFLSRCSAEISRWRSLRPGLP